MKEQQLLLRKLRRIRVIRKLIKKDGIQGLSQRDRDFFKNYGRPNQGRTVMDIKIIQ